MKLSVKVISDYEAHIYIVANARLAEEMAYAEFEAARSRYFEAGKVVREAEKNMSEFQQARIKDAVHASDAIPQTGLDMS